MWGRKTELTHAGQFVRATPKLNWLPAISFVVTVVLAIVDVNSSIASASQALHFSDDFNRPDGVVGNGWEATTENAIGDLVIKGNTLSTTIQPNDSGLAGISRQVDTNNLDSITLSGTLTHANGFGNGSRYRYESGYLLGSNGSLNDGYHVIFSRSDYTYNNSSISLWYGGLHRELISTINTPFQYDDTIETSVTYSFSDGRIFGEVKSGAGATTFDFGPQANKITGNRFGMVLQDPDTRGFPLIYPTFDNYVVQSNNKNLGIFGDPNQTDGLSGVLDLDPYFQHQPNNIFQQPPDTRKRNVAILVHGWNSDPATWANDTKMQIETRLGALNMLCSTAPHTVNPCWEVRTYDWSAVSGFTPSVIPHLAYVYAYVIGPRLASEVIDAYGSELNHVHLIGHSAGAHVIHRAAKKFESEKKGGRLAPSSLHLTFLDAFTPTPIVDAMNYGDVDYGVIPNFSDSYMSTFPPSITIADALLTMTSFGVPAKAFSYFIWSQTAQKLANAYHVGVSVIDQETSITDPISWAIQDHAWPYQFYQCSSNPTLDRFISEGFYTSEFCPPNNGVYAFGYPLSLENNPSTTVQILRSQYKPGHGCSAISATDCVALSEAVKVKFVNTIDAVVNLGNTIISETGNAFVKLGNKLYDLKADLTNLVNEHGQNAFLPAIQQLNLSTGSPVWVRFRIDMPEGANLLRFKFRFNQEGPGYLRAFLHGKQIWAADQRDFQMGSTFDADMSIGEVGPGNYEIAFRLDPLTANQASVELTHMALVRLDAVDALNLVPTANAGANRTVRFGSLVTLDGSASTDPDNAPQPLSYTWTQSTGPSSVSLNGSNVATPNFTPNSSGSYGFDLLVSDGMANSPPATVVITVPKLGDIDGDGDVDNNDLSVVVAARNKSANGPNDLRDLDGNMKIDALDARKLTTLCSRLRCATQ